jgi:hypothetical protein
MHIKTILSIIFLFSFSLQNFSYSLIPVTGSKAFGFFSDSPAEFLRSFTEFTSEITANTGNSGIFVENILADRIVQQPQGNPGFVSPEKETVTQFNMASQFGTIGILAHNTAAGEAFFDIQTDDIIYLVQSSGGVQAFVVIEIQKYQALSPDDPYSNFVDLSNPSSTISAQTLFLRTYGRGGGLILQTCIESAGNPSWGRLFVIAQPLSVVPSSTQKISSPFITYKYSRAAQIN